MFHLLFVFKKFVLLLGNEGYAPKGRIERVGDMDIYVGKDKYT